jgi:hypothetical protein
MQSHMAQSAMDVFDRLVVRHRSRNNCVDCCLRVAKSSGSFQQPSCMAAIWKRCTPDVKWVLPDSVIKNRMNRIGSMASEVG